VTRFCDETHWGFGWIAAGRMHRTSHALRSGGRVWIVDPVDADGVDERIRALGEAGGVLQLLDRHNRDCAAFAARFGVPHHVLPLGRLDGVPFEFLLVRKGRFWKETALWWEEQRVLCLADALGTTQFFCARGEALGLHPLLRLIPPRKRLGGVSPRHVLCGHGEGVHGDQAESAYREALSTARRRIPRMLASVASRSRAA
jgi:glyoxylase-like metal-dependent hydrolase (beta-lactamase superfamily II)